MAARLWLAPDAPWQQASDSDGVVRITFDPMSLATTEYYCNGSFARMAGLTVGQVRPPLQLESTCCPFSLCSPILVSCV
jgi:hypothetical protein